MTLNPRQRVHFGPRPTITDRQWKLIGAIADRAAALFPDRERKDILMDVSCVHANICPLRLDDLFTANDVNFVHDIVGIERHLDRSAFELRDCFVPRFAERPVK